MKFKKNQAWFDAFACACRGIWLVAVRERNMKVHCVATVFVIGFAYTYRVTEVEWALLILAMGAVWMAELFNTAVEAIVDLVCPQFSPEARFIKDAAAGSVLIASLVAVAVGCTVFFDKIFS